MEEGPFSLTCLSSQSSEGKKESKRCDTKKQIDTRTTFKGLEN